MGAIGAGLAGSAASSAFLSSASKNPVMKALTAGSVGQTAAAAVGQQARSAAFKGAALKAGIGAGSTLLSSAYQSATAGQMMTGSNANGGSVSSPVHTQCYLAISRPQWSAPSTYRKQFGYPSDISGVISETFHGFLSVRAIYMDNISATADEKSEIEQLMAAGVYVDDNFGPEEE